MQKKPPHSYINQFTFITNKLLVIRDIHVLALNYYFGNEFLIKSFSVCYLIKRIKQCETFETNILNIKICLTITNKISSDAKKIDLTFSDFNKLLIKQTES